MRKKTPENETGDEKKARKYLEQVAGQASRKEKVSWDRKMDNMIKLLGDLRPIEAKIVELQAKKQPILDEVEVLRDLMIKECVHPADQLVYIPVAVDASFGLTMGTEHAKCKFCNKKLVLRSTLED